VSSRILVIGEIASALVRRTRRDSGAVFGVFEIRDTDRMEFRTWNAFVNDPALIEEIERLRVGEPIGVSGPFSIRFRAEAMPPEIVHSVTVAAIVDTRPRKAKTKTLIRKEQAVKSDAAPVAPSEPKNGGRDFDDDLPF